MVLSSFAKSNVEFEIIIIDFSISPSLSMSSSFFFFFVVEWVLNSIFRSFTLFNAIYLHFFIIFSVLYHSVIRTTARVVLTKIFIRNSFPIWQYIYFNKQKNTELQQNIRHLLRLVLWSPNLLGMYDSGWQ